MIDVRWKAYGVAAGIFALDRLSKWIIETRVSFWDTHKVIPGFFDIVHSQNRGVAFGLFNEASAWGTGLLVALSLGAVALVSVLLWKPEKLDARSLWGFAFILGGAAGNAFDRVMWGRVTDFLLLYLGNYQWPTFNVADTAVVIGSGLLLLEILRPKRQAANVP